MPRNKLLICKVVLFLSGLFCCDANALASSSENIINSMQAVDVTAFGQRGEGGGGGGGGGGGVKQGGIPVWRAAYPSEGNLGKLCL